MALYLVTGGAGFIGSHLAAAIQAKGDKVRILDNFSTGSRDNLSAAPGAELIEGDIRSYHIVRDAVDGCDFVLHQAAGDFHAIDDDLYIIIYRSRNSQISRVWRQNEIPASPSAPAMMSSMAVNWLNISAR